MKANISSKLRKTRRSSVGVDLSTSALATLKSPRLLPEHSSSVTRKVALRFHALQAERVVITGSFAGWARDGIPMSLTKDGWWTTELELAPGQYEYRFIVDGEWANGPDADGYVSNPFGTFNCLLVVA